MGKGAVRWASDREKGLEQAIRVRLKGLSAGKWMEKGLSEGLFVGKGAGAGSQRAVANGSEREQG